MAKSHERVIVDVRDLFGEKKEKIDISELTSSSNGPSSVGGWSNALGDGQGNASSVNDNVVFGARSGIDISGRRQKDLSRPQVLVDVDVGINDQITHKSDPSIWDGDSLITASHFPPVSHVQSRSTGGTAADSPWSFGPVKSSGSAGDHLDPRNMSGRRNNDRNVQPIAQQGKKLTDDDSHGQVSRSRGTELASSESRYKSQLKDTSDQRTNVAGPMNNFMLGADPRHNQKRHGQGVMDMSGLKRNLPNNSYNADHSSSGVETDESTTPENTALASKAIDLRKRPLPPLPIDAPQPPPPPPPPPASGMVHPNNIDIGKNFSSPKSSSSNNQNVSNHGADSSYHSEEASDAEDEGSDFYEDEVTLEFDDEDDDGHQGGNKKLIYQEYQGDDFGQFLNEEHAGEPGIGPRGKKKRLRRRKKKEEAPSPGNSTASASSGEATVNKKRTLKGRIAAVFMGNTNSSQRGEPLLPNNSRRFDAGNTIHTFSFADSKIGNSLTRHANVDPKMGVPSFDLAPCDAAYGGERKWWDTDTLSARTLQSNSDVLLMPRRAGPDQDAGGNSSSNFIMKKPRSVGETTHEINTMEDDIQGPDFESMRKSVIYGVSEDRKSRKNTLFNRLKKDQKSNGIGNRDNTVVNPLSGLQ